MTRLNFVPTLAAIIIFVVTCFYLDATSRPLENAVLAVEPIVSESLDDGSGSVIVIRMDAGWTVSTTCISGCEDAELRILNVEAVQTAMRVLDSLTAKEIRALHRADDEAEVLAALEDIVNDRSEAELTPLGPVLR